MKLQYRKCTIENLQELSEFSRVTFKEAFEKDNDPLDFEAYLSSAFTPDQILSELKNPLCSFFFVLQGDELVGYFKLNEGVAQSEIKKEDSLELERFYVKAKKQGQNLGAEILNYIKVLGKKRAKAMLWLGVWQENPRAVKFYERHGFSKFGTHPYFIGSDEQTDWLMRFDLSTL